LQNILIKLFYKYNYMNDIDIIYKQINTQGYYICNNYISNIEQIENEFNIIINDQNNLFDLNTGKNKCLRTNLNGNYLNVKNFPNICNNFNTQFIINICKNFNIILYLILYYERFII